MAITEIEIDSNTTIIDLVEKLNAVIEHVNTLTGFDGIEITGSTFKDGTIEGTPIGLSVPAAGRFSSITLSTPLSVDGGGTGGNTQESARSGLGLGLVALDNIVPISRGGTGSQNEEDARTALGLGDVATKDVVPLDMGGTGATTQSGARTALGAAAAVHTHSISQITNLESTLNSLSTNKFDKSGGTITGKSSVSTGSTTSQMNSSTGQAALEIKVANTQAAMIEFDRTNYFAYFGLDTDNQLKIGGGNFGSTKHKIYHEGNILKGTSAPSSGVGTNGDIFLVYE